MSQTKTKRGTMNGNALVDRARGVVVMAVPVGQRARDTATRGMHSGVHHARRWSAPRLEGLAEAVETTITPAFTSRLRRGADIVRPERQSAMRRMSRSMLSWRGLAALLAVLTAAGAAAGYTMRKRYTSAIDMEEDSADAVSVPAQAATDESVTEQNRVGSGW